MMGRPIEMRLNGLKDVIRWLAEHGHSLKEINIVME